MIKEHAGVTAGIFYYVIIGLLVVGIIGFGTMYFYPQWLGMERRAFKASHQYKESKQTSILVLVEKYNSVSAEIAKYKLINETEIVNSLRLQQDSIKARIRRDANLIPSEEVPQSALRIIQ